MKDEGRGTRDEGRGTRDEGRGTRDEGLGARMQYFLQLLTNYLSVERDGRSERFAPTSEHPAKRPAR